MHYTGSWYGVGGSCIWLSRSFENKRSILTVINLFLQRFCYDTWRLEDKWKSFTLSSSASDIDVLFFLSWRAFDNIILNQLSNLKKGQSPRHLHNPAFLNYYPFPDHIPSIYRPFLVAVKKEDKPYSIILLKILRYREEKGWKSILRIVVRWYWNFGT